MSQKTFRLCTVLLTSAAISLLPLHFFAFQFAADAPTPTANFLAQLLSVPPFLDAALLVCSILLLRKIYHTPRPSKIGLVLAMDAVLLTVILAAHLLLFLPAVLFGF
ncbi:MAG: hypothetical protein KH050_07510 [Clostridiaceae bacterium]|nr:hypothetical protein [Clostridiaceae bacterium]